jgi:NADPH:quinone reductase-like Zn-dependent oxidoreductase
MACLGEMVFFEEDPQTLADGQFRVQTLFSGLSAGTELTFFKGTNPYLRAHWDEELCVFREEHPGLQYPITSMGYMEVARVVESKSRAVSVGEVVAATYGHRSSHVLDAMRDFYVVLPADLDPVLGIYAAQMGPICANGLLHAAADNLGTAVTGLGDGVGSRRILVTGAGVVGLLTGLFARHHGAATVAVADASAQRLEVATRLGFEGIRDDGEVWRFCKERWRHGTRDRGADFVFQCRGQASSLRTALKSVRPQGTVIDLAFYQDGADAVRFGEEFHHNGVTIRCAQIARVPRGLAFSWDRTRLAHEAIELLGVYGDLIKQYLITDVVPIAHAPEVIAELAARKRESLQVVFRFD